MLGAFLPHPPASTRRPRAPARSLRSSRWNRSRPARGMASRSRPSSASRFARAPRHRAPADSSRRGRRPASHRRSPRAGSPSSSGFPSAALPPSPASSTSCKSSCGSPSASSSDHGAVIAEGSADVVRRPRSSGLPRRQVQAGHRMTAPTARRLRRATTSGLTGIPRRLRRSQRVFDIQPRGPLRREFPTLSRRQRRGKITPCGVKSRARSGTAGNRAVRRPDITTLPRHAMPSRHQHVPEGRQLFPFIDVEENLDLGAYNRRSRPRARVTLDGGARAVPRLTERRRQLAPLSGGEQQMVAIASG